MTETIDISRVADPRIVKQVKKLTAAQRARLAILTTPRIVDPYFVHIPHPKQQFFLSLSAREVMYGGAAGGGKLLNVNQKVLTPKGWKRNGDLVVGDIVVNPRNGGSAKVVLVHPVQRVQVWRVFFDDGTHMDCGEDHLWTVKRAGKRNKKHNRDRAQGHDDKWLGGYEVITTSTLRDWANSAKSARSRGMRANAPMIPVNSAVEFTRPYRNIHATLPVDPYLLGLLIGDGHMPSTKITTADQDIAEWLEQWANNNSARITHDGKYGYKISGSPVLRAGLRSLGVLTQRSWEKHIPEDYLFAPLEWRTKLMQGLMDTDGYVDDRGHMSYTTVSEQLAHDVSTLARSLGAFAKITTKVPYYTLNGVRKLGRKAYTVWIKGHEPERFVSLPRKRARAIRQQNQPVRRVVRVAKLLRHEDMRCITVGTSDGLYIAGENFTVTHNSDALLMAAAQYVDVPGYSALILRRTWPDLNAPGAILDRAKTWWGGFDEVHIGDGGRIITFPSGARIQFGYLQHEKDRYKFQCFTPDTDILTVRGWVKVQDVTTDDMVASVDPKSRAMSYEHVSKTYSYEHDDEMVDVFQQNGVSFKVTKNHRVWSGTEKRRQLLPIPAEDLPYTATVPQTFEWNGAPASGKSFATRNRGGHSFTPEQWLKFLGWYVSEGNCGSYGGRWEVKITQQKGSGWKELHSDLGAVEGLYWADHKHVTLNNKALVEWLVEHTGTGAHNKRLPEEVFALSPKWANVLLSALVAGDGSSLSDKWARYYTYSRGLADDIMRLAVHAGWRPTLDIRDGGDYMPGSVTHIVHLSRRTRDTGLQTARKQTENSYWKNSPYKGSVYCVETPRFNTLVIRHRGRVSLSGNSAEYQFVGFDELTHFTETQYTYLFSRTRRPQVSCLNCSWAVVPTHKPGKGWKHKERNDKCPEIYPDPKIIQQYKNPTGGLTVFDVPLRVRSATNPGGIGHEWVRTRFVDPATRRETAIFVPASLRDNPSLDRESYVENLSEMTVTDRERLLAGNWDVYEQGDYFSREMFEVIGNYNVQTGDELVRMWDMASTEGGGDYTVGTLLCRTKTGTWVVLDVVRGQWSSLQKEIVISRTAEKDGRAVPIRMEQEPGSSGKDVIDHYKRMVLPGYNYDGIRSTGSKEERAKPFSGQAEAGHVSIVAAEWNRKWLDEMSLFPVGANDDQVDSVAGAANWLAFTRRSRLLA